MKKLDKYLFIISAGSFLLFLFTLIKTGSFLSESEQTISYSLLVSVITWILGLIIKSYKDVIKEREDLSLEKILNIKE